MKFSENITPYTIIYGTDGKLKDNTGLITETLCEALKNGVGRLNRLNTDTVFVIKVNNNLTNLDTLEKELKNANNTAMQNEYMYFIKLDSELGQEKRNALKNCSNEKVKVLDDDITLRREIMNYLKIREDEKEEKELEESEYNIDSNNGIIKVGGLNSSTIINLKLKEKDNTTEPTPSPTPTTTPTPTHNTTSPNVGESTEGDIKGTIHVEKDTYTSESDKYEELHKKAYVKITKRYTPYGETETTSSKDTTTNTTNGSFQLPHISHIYDYCTDHEEEEDYHYKSTTAGTYRIFANIGGDPNSDTAGKYNGQNYDIEKIVVNGTTVNISETNRNEINEYFKKIGKDKAKIVNTPEITTLRNNCALEVESEEFSLSEEECNIDIYLKKRPEFRLEVTKKIAAAQMRLTDGQVLESYKNGDSHNYIDGGSESGNPLLYWQIDSEIMHGATIDIEYDIEVKNNSNIDCTEFTLIDYLDYNNGTLQYRKNSKMLTNNMYNSGNDDDNNNYHWKVVGNFRDELQNKTTTNLTEGRTYLKITDKATKGEIKKYKLLVSIVVTGQVNNYSYQNSAEIIEYKNTDCRVDTTSIPGNYNPGLLEVANTSNDRENDSAEAEELLITPPTGTKPKWYTWMFESILNLVTKIKK